MLNKNDIKETIIAPNPVADMLNVAEPVSIFINSMDVYDSKGGLLIHKNIQSDVQVYSLPVSALKTGNYILKINYKNDSKTVRFIKN